LIKGAISTTLRFNNKCLLSMFIIKCQNQFLAKRIDVTEMIRVLERFINYFWLIWLYLFFICSWRDFVKRSWLCGLGSRSLFNNGSLRCRWQRLFLCCCSSSSEHYCCITSPSLRHWQSRCKVLLITFSCFIKTNNYLNIQIINY